MREGERQVSPTLEGIRRDHRARYEFSAAQSPAGSRVIDFACGVGYGCRIMAEAGAVVVGYDIDPEAIAYAREHYAHPDARFLQASGDAPPDLPEADLAICFETIEHLEDPRPLLKALRAAAPRLIASVPNEAVFPYVGQAFHFRHYTRRQFAQLLEECGWRALSWYGQEGQESGVKAEVNGRTVLAVCERAELPAEAPAEKGPHVAILGLGPSLRDYVDLVKRLGGRSKAFDQVWAINALGDVLACDLVFHMDDVRIQQVRAEAKPASNIAAMLDWLKASPVPVMTSRAHPDYPALVEFPLEDVLNRLGFDYFNSTASYAIAYAIMVGASKISCFGMDFTYPNAHDAEKGRACVEFWLGQAAARGIRIGLPRSSSLMDSCYSRAERLYGYDTLEVSFDHRPDGALKLSFAERAELPSAAEIEDRYDHTKHPNALVEASRD